MQTIRHINTNIHIEGLYGFVQTGRFRRYTDEIV